MGGSSVHSDVHFYCKICKLIPTKGWVGLKTGEKMLTSYVNIPEDIYKIYIRGRNYIVYLMN